MGFQIDWRLDDAEWEKARQVARVERKGSEYDRGGEAFFLLLWGRLQFRLGEKVLFPPDRLVALAERRRANHIAMGDPWYPIDTDVGAGGIQISILDVADQLLQIARTLSEYAGSETMRDTFWQNEGGRTIEFARSGNVVTIASDLFTDISLTTPADEFMNEARRFLLDFIGAIEVRVPALLEWKSLEQLRRYHHEQLNGSR